MDIQENSYLAKTVHQVYCEDPVDIAIETYKNHPSILKIREMVTSGQEFNFSAVELNEVEDLTKKLNIKKGTTFKSFLLKY